MRLPTCAACLAISLLGSGIRSQEPVVDEVPAFVELDLGGERRYVREPFRATVRFGVETGFFASAVVQPFHRALDVPLRVETGWEEVDGARPLSESARGIAEPGRTCIVDGRATTVERLPDREVDGRTHAVWQFVRTFVATAPGSVGFRAPRLHVTFATRFREDFVAGRIAEDPRDAVVTGAPRTLRIEALPIADRPPGFTGAVGRFVVEADAEPREVTVGETVRFVLRIEGEGDLEAFDAPRLDTIAGFHVYGRIEEPDRSGRTIVYEIAPLSADVTEVPAVQLAFFDPGPPAGYKTTSTAPVGLVVRSSGVAEEPPAPAADTTHPAAAEDDIRGFKTVAPWRAAPAPPPSELPGALVLLGLLAPWLVFAGFGAWRRIRSVRANDPTRNRVRSALAAFRHERSGSEGASLRALCAFLGVHLGIRPAAVIGPGLAQRLADAGVPEPWSARAASLVDELLAARFSGAHGGARDTDLDAFVRSFSDAVLGARRGS